MLRSHHDERRTRRMYQPAPAVLLSALLLAACGGGSDDEPTSPAPSPTLALSGTAATGAAIAASSVEAKCATGTGTATSAADGRYTISITGGALPCVLRVNLAAGGALHAVALGSGSSATANLTPLTQLVLARHLGADPATLWADFSAAKVPAADVAAATAAVVATLKAAGADFSALGNPFSAPLVAATAGAAGNAYDQALDVLKNRMSAASLTLTDLTTTVLRSSPKAPPTALSTAPSLPPELALAPAATTCSSLRSGRYRYILAMPSGTIGRHAVGAFTLDASTLSVRDDEGDTFTIVPNGACRYTTPTGELVVSAAGIGVFRSTEDGVRRMGIVVPEQTHTLDALAGEWNMLFVDNGGSALSASRGTYTLDGQGRFTAGQWCDRLTSCVTDGAADLAAVTVSVNAGGGFTLKDSAESGSGRYVAYRNGGGQMLLVGVAESGEIGFITRSRTLSLPTTTGVPNNSWGLGLGASLVAGTAFTESSNTIRTIDAGTSSYVRDAVFNFSTGATAPETLQLNTPANGYTRRVGGPATGSDGSSRTVSEFLVLSLPGMGIAPVWLPGNASFTLSVTKAQ